MVIGLVVLGILQRGLFRAPLRHKGLHSLGMHSSKGAFDNRQSHATMSHHQNEEKRCYSLFVLMVPRALPLQYSWASPLLTDCSWSMHLRSQSIDCFFRQALQEVYFCMEIRSRSSHQLCPNVASAQLGASVPTSPLQLVDGCPHPLRGVAEGNRSRETN